MPRRVLEGKVVSDKCDKTVTVIVERRVRDANYGKIIRRSEKYAAHDEGNVWKTGDTVRIEECRPLSKSKRWRVISGEASGESRATTVDDVNHGKVSVKRVVAEAPVAKKEVKADKKPAGKKDK
jgi:small subunit ribosomal protein S17